MTNYEFYKNSNVSTSEMFNDFEKSGFPTFDKFLATKHFWKPKYAVGDIVRLQARPGAKTIVKIDYKRERYICVNINYLTGTLLYVFVSGGKLEYNHLRYAAEYMSESDIEEKLGRLEYKAFLNKIADIEAQGRP